MRTVTVQLDRAVAGHFLLRTLRISCHDLTRGRPLPRRPVGVGFGFDVDDSSPCTIRLTIEALYPLGVDVHQVLRIDQTYAVESQTAPWLLPVRWVAGATATRAGRPVASPSHHPMLSAAGDAITVRPAFLDITDMFMKVHGQTPHFVTLGMLKSTDFTLRVVACLLGHPFIWYVAVPRSASTSATVAPHVALWAADYGGIAYAADRESGITTPNHSTTVSNVQCGGDTLCSYLLAPLSDADVLRHFKTYVPLRDTWARQNPKAVLPPQVHCRRGVLEYIPVKGTPVPLVWQVPFGLERSLEGTNRVLIFPQVAGGNAGIVLRPGLRARVRELLAAIGSHTATFTPPVPSPELLVLSCYSQAGGNLFTAAANNARELRGVICVEPQYMNDHLKGEDTNLTLGRQAIPVLLKASAKVVVVSRRSEAWQRAKYLPRGVPTSSLLLLPTAQHLGLLHYPQHPTHPLVKYRYRRLLAHRDDPVLAHVLGAGRAVAGARWVGLTEETNAWIDKRRATGASDEQLLSAVFTPAIDRDASGGYYTHNFLMAGGEDESAFEPDGRPKADRHYRTFLQQAIDLVG